MILNQSAATTPFLPSSLPSSNDTAATSSWTDFWASAAITYHNYTDCSYFMDATDTYPYNFIIDVWSWKCKYSSVDLASTEKSVHGLLLKGKLRMQRFTGKIRPTHRASLQPKFNMMSRGFENERQH